MLTVEPKAFASLPFLTFGLRPEPGWEYDLFFDRGRFFPGEAVRIESTELICRMVADGAGASILPRLCVAMSAYSEDVATAELDVPAIAFDWHLLHSADTPLDLLDRIEQDAGDWLAAGAVPGKAGRKAL
jgi:LysR family transcriptional regulator for metE and metH